MLIMSELCVWALVGRSNIQTGDVLISHVSWFSCTRLMLFVTEWSGKRHIHNYWPMFVFGNVKTRMKKRWWSSECNSTSWLYFGGATLVTKLELRVKTLDINFLGRTWQWWCFHIIVLFKTLHGIFARSLSPGEDSWSNLLPDSCTTTVVTFWSRCFWITISWITWSVVDIVVDYYVS